MKFKVGDRVRKVVSAAVDPANQLPGDVGISVPVGAEGTYIGSGACYGDPRGTYAYVIFDGIDSSHHTRAFAVSFWQIEPLTKPPLLSVEEEIERLLNRGDLIDFNPKPKHGEIVQAGDV